MAERHITGSLFLSRQLDSDLKRPLLQQRFYCFQFLYSMSIIIKSRYKMEQYLDCFIHNRIMELTAWTPAAAAQILSTDILWPPTEGTRVANATVFQTSSISMHKLVYLQNLLSTLNSTWRIHTDHILVYTHMGKKITALTLLTECSNTCLCLRQIIKFTD